MNHTAKSTAITLYPTVVCVGPDGERVPEHERDVPHVEPDPTDPMDWPAWTDNWFWGTTEGPDEPPDGPDGDPHCRFPGTPGFEPSEQDLADLAAWSAEVEARRDWADHVAEIRAAEEARNPVELLYGYE
jgi:hypothetical protein